VGAERRACSRWPDSLPDEIVDLMTLSARERIAAVVLFSDGVFTGALLSQVRDYLDDLEKQGCEFR
jgi:hypothetical protein